MAGGDLMSEAPGSLIGRDNDLENITAFVDQAAGSGGALLLSGEAGVGKTVLLDAVAAHPKTAGSRVLRAAGAEFEGAVSFAGLNQLVGPLLGQARGLSATYRRALAVALGVREGSSPDRLMLSNAVLALLVQATGTGPVLVVDDLPWLMPSSQGHRSAAALSWPACAREPEQRGKLSQVAGRGTADASHARSTRPGFNAASTRKTSATFSTR